MAEVTPGWRNDDLGNGQFVGDVDRVHRSRSPEGTERERPRVVPRSIETSRMPCTRLLTVTQDGISGVDNGNAKRRGDPFLNRPLCGGTIQFPAIPFPPEVRVEAAEQELRIGGCRLCSAVPVADRTGIAPALRADLQAATRVDPGDRTSARAERVDIDRRYFNGNAEFDEPPS